MDAIKFPENLLTTSGLSIFMHSVILLTDAMIMSTIKPIYRQTHVCTYFYMQYDCRVLWPLDSHNTVRNGCHGKANCVQFILLLSLFYLIYNMTAFEKKSLYSPFSPLDFHVDILFIPFNLIWSLVPYTGSGVIDRAFLCLQIILLLISFNWICNMTTIWIKVDLWTLAPRGVRGLCTDLLFVFVLIHRSSASIWYTTYQAKNMFALKRHMLWVFRQAYRQTERKADARGKTICLPTLTDIYIIY